ncbi:MAG: flagellar motor protein MotB [bacterium]
MSDDEPKEEVKEGLPGWMGTFADLMSLLMCFFVLLLSFSEIEAKKYKQVAGSMKEAFGVQREIHADESPKGTSFVAQEFSPGKPEPTPINEIRQSTTDELKMDLDWTDSNAKDKAKTEERVDEEELKEAKAKVDQAVAEKVDQTMQMLEQALKQEIDKGLVELENKDNKVIIRIMEKGSFKSGRANIQAAFVPTLDKISRILGKTPGDIIVAGHTDNVPISTRQFPSNWELSAARAATFVHFMKRRGKIKSGRLELRAYADSKPLDSNKNKKGRARNRRVEIMLLADSDTTIKPESQKSISKDKA